MKKKEVALRYILFVVSLFFSALGVAITKHGELGVSPISSVPNVVSLKLTFLSMGNWLIIWNCILILGQVLILRKDFKLISLLQIPLSFVFGWFTDLCLLIVSPIPTDFYPVKLICVVIGTIVLGFGISLAVAANVIMNAGEAFVNAISLKTGKEFGNVKIIFDISCVVLSVVLSLIFFNFTLKGAREGTIIAAFCTGLAVKFFTRIVNKPLNGFIKKLAGAK